MDPQMATIELLLIRARQLGMEFCTYSDYWRNLCAS
jgi:hypothetical protein